MLVDYLTLGLKPDASDTTIRKQYLELIKRYTPEQAPVRFQEISTAYERIKDQPSRIKSQIFETMNIQDTEKAVFDLVRAAKPHRQRVGLKTLLAAVGIDRE